MSTAISGAASLLLGLGLHIAASASQPRDEESPKGDKSETDKEGQCREEVV